MKIINFKVFSIAIIPLLRLIRACMCVCVCVCGYKVNWWLVKISLNKATDFHKKLNSIEREYDSSNWMVCVHINVSQV